MSKMETKTPSPAPVGPPPWTDVGRHGVFPEGKHDEIARFNFLASLNVHIATKVFPGNRTAYEKRVLPRAKAELGREPSTRQEVKRFMEDDEYYRFWSSMRRSYMEMRQENGRTMVMRQADQLAEKAKRLNEGKATLELDPRVTIPPYQAAVDIHCMPGSYYTEVRPDDVTAAANYDAGIFATTGGLLGKFNDGGGRAMAAWLARTYPDFKPKKILELGTGLGHSILPVAKLFPEAEIWANDVAAPMLRYGHARAQSMGVTNVRFIQENAEKTRFADEEFDLVITAQFWHETSRKSLPVIMKEIRRVLKKGGLTIHLEQPPYHTNMPPYDAFIRDWDAHYNNEPFWTTYHDMKMMDELERAGFDRANSFETTFMMVPEADFGGESKMDQGKDFGRGGSWYGFGAWK